jgi:hypothetical protein
LVQITLASLAVPVSTASRLKKKSLTGSKEKFERKRIGLRELPNFSAL